jgi:hypothetical protein
MHDMPIVNASPILTDAEVRAVIAPLQTQIDRDFLPAWGDRAEPVKLRFAPASEIPHLPPDCWPIFLNRHSTDASVLGWHDDDPDQNIRVYSRVFAGDCKLFGLNWEVTLGHEALELILDPDIKLVWRMPDGRLAALEAADAVESDALAYLIDGHKVTNFVLPAYFSTDNKGPWDYRHALRGPCPQLTPGGYMSITDAHGNWTQTQAERHDGLVGRRAVLPGFRRQARARWAMNELEIV